MCRYTRWISALGVHYLVVTLRTLETGSILALVLVMSACTHKDRAHGPAAPRPAVGSASSSSGPDCAGASIDYVASAHGERTANDALARYIRENGAQFPQRGWVRGNSTADRRTFTAGPSSIETERLRDGSWVVTGYKSCR